VLPLVVQGMPALKKGFFESKNTFGTGTIGISDHVAY
jgi:hypothetical protein